MNNRTGGTIYGVQKGNQFHYIGKTSSNKRRKVATDLTISDARYQYTNPEIRKVIIDSEDIKIITLKEVGAEEWYDEKLQEVVKKHKDNHPLMNSQWMLDGKRGYWSDKKRDKHTLYRLSESKYKKAVQYDSQGNLLKIWDSGKEIAIKIFKDYKVVKGSAESDIYDVLAKALYHRFALNCYWFRVDELQIRFGGIPNKIDIIKLHQDLLVEKKANRKPSIPEYKLTYTIKVYDTLGNHLLTFEDAEAAAAKFKVSISHIRKICTGLRDLNNGLTLKYGRKTKKYDK